VAGGALTVEIYIRIAGRKSCRGSLGAIESAGFIYLLAFTARLLAIVNVVLFVQILNNVQIIKQLNEFRKDRQGDICHVKKVNIGAFFS
jgi:hypothetical protein